MAGNAYLGPKTASKVTPSLLGTLTWKSMENVRARPVPAAVAAWGFKLAPRRSEFELFGVFRRDLFPYIYLVSLTVWPQTAIKVGYPPPLESMGRMVLKEASDTSA